MNKNDLFRVKIQLVGQIGTVPAGLGLKAALLDVENDITGYYED